MRQHIDARFSNALMKRSIPTQEHFQYKKWLRLYLDFCSKYNHLPTNGQSLAPFIRKLKSKNQSAQQQKQASEAISLFYETENQESESNDDSALKDKTKKISIKNEAPPSTNACPHTAGHVCKEFFASDFRPDHATAIRTTESAQEQTVGEPIKISHNVTTGAPIHTGDTCPVWPVPGKKSH
jgi:hypothetical protein